MRRDDLTEFRAALAGLEGRIDEALAGYREAIAGAPRAGRRTSWRAWMALDQLIVLGPINDSVREEAAAHGHFRATRRGGLPQTA